MSDLIIDESTGRVAYIEISRGYIDDLMGGRIICGEFSLRPQTGDAIVADAFYECAGRGAPGTAKVGEEDLI